MSRVIAAFTQFFKGDGSPLANGYLRFLISQTTSTDKATYADVNQTIPNANPVQLDGEGRCPNIFGQGIYKVVLYDINPVTGLPGMMVQTFDPVVADYQSEGAGGNFAEWESGAIYQIGQIVIYNGLYYRSHIANNVGNQPDISADSWERIDFLRFWNLDVTYGLDDVVIYGSQLYFSLQAGNLNHIPSTSPAWWDPVGSGTVLLNWQESGTAFIPVSAGYNLGSATNFIGDIYQGDNSIHYFGTGQDASLYFDSNDFYITTVGDLIAGTLDASEIILTTQSFSRWRIKSDGHFIPDANLDIGGAALPVGDVYQGSDQHLYIGDSQQIDVNYDGTDLYLNIGANAWALLAAGNIEPQTDATFYFGGASNRLRQIYVSDDPSVDDHVVIKSYLDGSLYTLKTNKNYLDNGDFQIWQRGTSQSVSGILSDDRWQNYNAGNLATVTHSQQSFTLGQTDVPGEPEFFSRTNITVSADSNVFVQKFQTIINVRRLAGRQVKLSFYASADTTRYVYARYVQTFGTGGSGGVLGDQLVTLSAGFSRYSITFNIPSISGKTIGSGVNGTDISITMSVGSNFSGDFPELLNQTGTFDIAEIQLEDGPIATDFEQIDFEASLFRCLPHYCKTYNYEVVPGTASSNAGMVGFQLSGITNAGSDSGFAWHFPVPMALTPSVTIYSPASGTANLVSVPGTGTEYAVSTTIIGKNGVVVYPVTVPVLTYRGFFFQAVAETGY